MQTQIRKIGNSKGVIIPATFLAQVGFKDAVDISVKNQQVIISPSVKHTKKPREGWFDNYDSEQDIDFWEGFIELSSEQEDWEW